MLLSTDLLVKLSVAIAPALVLLLVFARLDAFKLVRFTTVLLLLLAGGALAGAAYLANALGMDALPLGFASYSRYAAPVVEEGLKAALVLALFATNRIGFKTDAAIVGFAVGAGFSVLENAYYLYLFSSADAGVWLVRGFGTAVMHGGAAALFAVISHEMTEIQAEGKAHAYRFNPLLYLPGLGAAIAIHSAFNHFPGVPLAAMTATLLLVPLTLLLVFSMGERATREWLRTDHDAHHRALEDIRSGRYLESEAGQRVLALTARFRSAVAADLLDYVHVHTELVLRAEAVLLAKSAGEEVEVGEAERALFERLRALERRLGKAILLAIRPHLHFTRNDLWELAQLQAIVRAA